jgi:hypothetical protein
MAYVSQEMKKDLAPQIKAVLNKYGLKGSIGVRHHSSLVVNIKSGILDLIGASNKHRIEDAKRRGSEPYINDNYIQVNENYMSEWMEEVGESKIAKFYDELVAAMKGVGSQSVAWYNNSDIMIDYFDRAYYIDINVGQWNKPYEVKV